ncbi:MAG: hypothetical protein ACM3KR_09905 [Deltaproteobacteria bacterium]
MVSDSNEFLHFQEYFIKSVESTKNRRFYKENDSYMFLLNNEISIFFEVLPTDKEFSYSFDLTSFTFKKGDNDLEFEIKYNNQIFYVCFFIPSGALISFDSTSLIIKGTTLEIGHKAFLFEISCKKLTSVEYLLATNKNYPDNDICGFDIKQGENKFIIFKHSENMHLNCNNKPKYKHAVFSVMKFQNNYLKDIWAYNKECQLVNPNSFRRKFDIKQYLKKIRSVRKEN